MVKKNQNESRQVTQIAFLVMIMTAIWIPILAALVFAAGGMTQPAQFPHEHGYRSAVAALELGRNMKDLTGAIGLPDTDSGREIRASLQKNTSADLFFIPVYTLTLMAISA